MKQLIAPLLAAFVVLVAAPAVAQFGPPGAPAEPQPLPPGVTRLQAVTYEALEGYRPVNADLYLPPAGKGPYPAVIYFHGGAWANGSPSAGGFGDQMARLAAHGYVVMGATYRFTSEAHFPAQVQDAKAAVRWLRANAARYNVDPARIGAWGESAGGYLAAMVGTSCGEAALEPLPPQRRGPPPGLAMPGMGAPPPPPPAGPPPSTCVQAVVDYYGVTDFTPAFQAAVRSGKSPQNADGPFLGCDLAKCDPGLVERARVMHYVDKSDPPFLIFHGTADTMVSPKQSDDLKAALQAAAVPVELIPVTGANHIFIGATPAQRADIEARTIAFFDRTIGKR